MVTEEVRGEDRDGVAVCGGKDPRVGGIGAKAVGAVMERCMGVIGTLRSSELMTIGPLPFIGGPPAWWLPC